MASTKLVTSAHIELVLTNLKETSDSDWYTGLVIPENVQPIIDQVIKSILYNTFETLPTCVYKTTDELDLALQELPELLHADVLLKYTGLHRSYSTESMFVTDKDMKAALNKEFVNNNGVSVAFVEESSVKYMVGVIEYMVECFISRSRSYMKRPLVMKKQHVEKAMGDL